MRFFGIVIVIGLIALTKGASDNFIVSLVRRFDSVVTLRLNLTIYDYEYDNDYTQQCFWQINDNIDGEFRLAYVDNFFFYRVCENKPNNHDENGSRFTIRFKGEIGDIGSGLYEISGSQFFMVSSRRPYYDTGSGYDLVPSCSEGGYRYSGGISYSTGPEYEFVTCVGSLADLPQPTTTTQSTTTTTTTTMATTTTTALMTTASLSNSTVTDIPDNSTSPYSIDCDNPQSSLEILYCDFNNGSLPTSANVTNIINETTSSFNPDNITVTELYMVSKVVMACSNVPNLTTEQSQHVGGLIDKLMDSSTDVFVDGQSNGLDSSTVIYQSIATLLQNSPPNVTFLTGQNFGFISNPLNCATNADAGAMGATKHGFTVGHGSSDVLIAVNGAAACSNKDGRERGFPANHVYYTIYKNMKLFMGSAKESNGIIGGAFLVPNRDDATTSTESLELKGGCKRGFLATDGQVLSATTVNRTECNCINDTVIHQTAGGQKLVELRFKTKTIGVALHGTFKLTYWIPETRKWARETCNVQKKGDYYISECTHLTDFTLIVDGSSRDPILCDTALIAVNYVVVIGSILSLLFLNAFYGAIFFLKGKMTLITRLESFAPPRSRDSLSTSYNLALMLFFFMFAIFTNEETTTGHHGCMTVAIINYWLLTVCIILSMFQSWLVIKKFIWTTKMERVFDILTKPAVIYGSAIGGPTLLALCFGLGTKGAFFYRNDSFCWIRSDFITAGVILPTTFLVINAGFCLYIMVVRLFPHIFSKLFSQSGASRVITEASAIDTKERLMIIFLTQLTIGTPWLLQYLSLFLSSASAWHYLFAIVNGAQGIIILFVFGYRVLKYRRQRNPNCDDDEGPKTHRNYDSGTTTEPEINDHKPASRQSTLEAVFNEISRAIDSIKAKCTPKNRSSDTETTDSDENNMPEASTTPDRHSSKDSETIWQRIQRIMAPLTKVRKLPQWLMAKVKPSKEDDRNVVEVAHEFHANVQETQKSI